MVTVSACIIVKGNEPVFANTLSSIKSCVDELIIADTGLDEASRKQVEAFMQTNPQVKCKVYSLEWPDDFAEARNETMRHATKDWVLIIDADEIILPRELRITLDQASHDPNVMGVRIVQKTYTDDTTRVGFVPKEFTAAFPGNNVTFKGSCSNNIVRIIKNDQRIQFEHPIHETVEPSIQRLGGTVLNSQLTIHHLKEIKGQAHIQKTREHYLSIYLKKLDKCKNKAKAYSDIGMLYATLYEDYTTAVKYMTRSIEESSKIEKRPEGKTLVMLGYYCLKIDRPLEAKKVLTRFAKNYPHHPNIKNAREMLGGIERYEQQLKRTR